MSDNFSKEVEDLKQAVNDFIENDADFRSNLREAIDTKSRIRVKKIIVDVALTVGNITGTVVDAVLNFFVGAVEGGVKGASQAIKDSQQDCFVATFIYKSDQAEEVIALKHFRDRHLRKHSFGRVFISFYYNFIGPRTVKFLIKHGSKPILDFIKKILDVFVVFCLSLNRRK
jgi:hypothetical protein